MPAGYSVSTHRERTIPPTQVKRLYGLEGWWPKRRHHGVATGVLARLIDELRDVHLVSLFSSAELTPIYERLGFRATRQVVMHRHREQQCEN